MLEAPLGSRYTPRVSSLFPALGLLRAEELFPACLGLGGGSGRTWAPGCTFRARLFALLCGSWLQVLSQRRTGSGLAAPSPLPPIPPPGLSNPHPFLSLLPFSVSAPPSPDPRSPRNNGGNVARPAWRCCVNLWLILGLYGFQGPSTWAQLTRPASRPTCRQFGQAGAQLRWGLGWISSVSVSVYGEGTQVH